MKKYKTGLLVGRFQPFHKGHLWLIKHALQHVNTLIIGVGSANLKNHDNNFLTYEQRKEMLEKVINEENLKDKIIKIVPLNDFYDDELWFQKILRVTGGKFDIVVGNNEWVNRIFEKRGYKILRVGYYKRYLYEGEKIRKLMKHTYRKRPLQISKGWKERVPKYLINSLKKSFMFHVSCFKFSHIALGGTFDHFHKGHETLIDTALKYGNHISIGITTLEICKDKDFSSGIESFDERKKSVTEYLKKKQSLKRITFFSLSDIYGSTKNDGTIEALVVSKLTYANAIKINKLRAKRKLPELKIICIKDIKGDDGKLISSERIRRGEIDRDGNNFQFSIFNFQKKQLILPEHLRENLRKPLGKVIRGKENELEITARTLTQSIDVSIHPMVIAVGDIIAMSLENTGFIPDVKIIDYRSRRKPIVDESLEILSRLNSSLPLLKQKVLKNFSTSSLMRVKNDPGTISKSSVNAIKKAIYANFEPSHPKGAQPQKSQTVVINGEEDLLALPAILLAPLGSVVLYGQMDLGVVMVKVTEKKKKEVKELLIKFI